MVVKSHPLAQTHSVGARVGVGWAVGLGSGVAVGSDVAVGEGIAVGEGVGAGCGVAHPAITNITPRMTRTFLNTLPKEPDIAFSFPAAVAASAKRSYFS